MKFSFLTLGISALQLNKSDFKPMPLENMIDEVLSGTVFGRTHNTKEDRAYLTDTFSRFTTLGESSDGELNGHRVLTEFNAKWAARDILKAWKSLKGQDLDDFIDSEQFHKIFKQFDYHNVNLID